MLRTEVKILVVDDVSAVRSQIRSLLKSFGFQLVTVAESGLTAQKLINAGKYDLILSDWHMEPMNGLQLLKYLKSKPETAQIPFIMVTAENTKTKVVEAIKLGIDDYLIKPLTIEQIEEKVHKVLIRRQIL